MKKRKPIQYDNLCEKCYCKISDISVILKIYISYPSGDELGKWQGTGISRDPLESGTYDTDIGRMHIDVNPFDIYSFEFDGSGKPDLNNILLNKIK